MTKVVVKICLVVLSMLVSFTSMAVAAGGCPFILKTSQFPVKTCLNQWHDEFFQRLGCEVIMLPHIASGRKNKMLLDGQLHYLVGLSITEPRKRLMKFSKPFAKQYFLLVTTEPERFAKANLWCDSVLSQGDVIVRSNIFISDDIESLKKHKNCARRVIEVNGTNEKAITMLKRGRGNLLVMSEPFWNRFKSNEPELVEGMTTLPLKLWPDPLAIGFNHNIAQEVMDKVNRQISADIERGYIPCNLHSPLD